MSAFFTAQCCGPRAVRSAGLHTAARLEAGRQSPPSEDIARCTYAEPEQLPLLPPPQPTARSPGHGRLILGDRAHRLKRLRPAHQRPRTSRGQLLIAPRRRCFIASTPSPPGRSEAQDDLRGNPRPVCQTTVTRSAGDELRRFSPADAARMRSSRPNCRHRRDAAGIRASANADFDGIGAPGMRVLAAAVIDIFGKTADEGIADRPFAGNLIDPVGHGSAR